MKLSFIIKTPERDKGFEEFEAKLKKLKELGYDGAELAIKDPLSCRVQKIKEVVVNSGLAVSSIDTGAGYIQNSPALNSLDEVVRIVAVGKIKEYIKIASMLKSDYVTISTIRGLFGEDPEIRKERIARFTKSLKECDVYALKHGVTLLLEPLIRFEADFINSARDAIWFLLTNKFHDVKILLDAFHMNVEDRFISDSFFEASTMNLLGHVHVADSNRLAPGLGHFDFDELFWALKRFNYTGFLTVEIIHPSNPSFEEVAEQSVNFLKKQIEKARN